MDGHNPTGYSQVLEQREWTTDGQLREVRSHILGLDVVGQAVQPQATATLAYIGYDGHGSTRMLLQPDGQLVAGEVYAYDAYGNTLTGGTLTEMQYSGEKTDPATGLQYLRARYYDPRVGRFLGLDPFGGSASEPLTLHKYGYCHGNPINGIDPTGMFSLSEIMLRVTVGSFLLTTVANTAITMSVTGSLARDIVPSAFVFSVGVGYAQYGFTAGVTAQCVVQFHPFDVDVVVTPEAGTAPMSGLKSRKHSGVGTLSAFGLAFNMKSISDLQGWAATATWPKVAARWSGLLIDSFSGGKATQRAMDFLSKYSQMITSDFIKNKSPGVVQFSQSTSGASVISFGAWSFGFGTTVGYGFSGREVVSSLTDRIRQAFSGVSGTPSPEDIGQRTQRFVGALD